MVLLVGPAGQTNWTDHLDGPSGQTSWTDQLDGPAGRTSWTDQLDGPVWWTSWTDQFFLFEALASSHMRRFSFQFVHCRSFRVRRRPCFVMTYCRGSNGGYPRKKFRFYFINSLVKKSPAPLNTGHDRRIWICWVYMTPSPCPVRNRVNDWDLISYTWVLIHELWYLKSDTWIL